MILERVQWGTKQLKIKIESSFHMPVYYVNSHIKFSGLAVKFRGPWKNPMRFLKELRGAPGGPNNEIKMSNLMWKSKILEKIL